MFPGREKGFTLAELLVVVLIIAILATLAIVFFTGQTGQAKDSTADGNLRSALVVVKVKYMEAGDSFLQGPLAVGADDQEKAENFVIGAISEEGNLEAVVSATPDPGQVGVQMNLTGTEGTLYAKNSSGYAERSLP